MPRNPRPRCARGPLCYINIHEYRNAILWQDRTSGNQLAIDLGSTSNKVGFWQATPHEIVNGLFPWNPKKLVQPPIPTFLDYLTAFKLHNAATSYEAIPFALHSASKHQIDNQEDCCYENEDEREGWQSDGMTGGRTEWEVATTTTQSPSPLTVPSGLTSQVSEARPVGQSKLMPMTRPGQ